MTVSTESDHINFTNIRIILWNRECVCEKSFNVWHQINTLRFIPASKFLWAFFSGKMSTSFWDQEKEIQYEFIAQQIGKKRNETSLVLSQINLSSSFSICSQFQLFFNLASLLSLLFKEKWILNNLLVRCVPVR